jgi:anionic cell wall polymer biosynthesis LytR-Cps2A-Psr (LCP) family protein
MKRFSFDKSSIFLLVIIGVVAGAAIFLFLSLRSDAVDQAMKSDRILNLAVVIEREGKPVSTQVFLFYPANARAALLDVPSETGLIIKSLNKVDRIDVLYDRRRPGPYVNEIAGLIQADLPYWIVLDESGLRDATDLLEGIEVFVPEAIDAAGPPKALLPAGALLLDGDKACQYAFYADPDEGDADRAARRQRLFQALIRRIGEKAAWLAKPQVYPAFRRSLRTNLSDEALRRLMPELAKMDADRLVLQRVTGAIKTVDGKRLLFPHYDGELVRDIVKQTLNALANSGSASPADKIFTLEVLNGTPTKGLAKRAAEIFQSFGYDVVSVGNADQEDVDRTSVVDRFSNTEAAKTIAGVIRCENVSQSGAVQTEGTKAVADFTVLLGKDFNGRYCVR